MIEPELPAITEEILDAIAREVPEYARPLEGAFGRGIRTGVDRGAAPVRRPDPRPRRRAAAGPRRLRRPRPRRAAPGPHPRLAAVRLPGRRPRRLAPDLRRRPRAPASTPSSLEPARRVDLRLHRRALGRLGRGLRRGAGRGRGRAPAPPPRAGRRCCCATRRPSRPTCAPRRGRPAGRCPAARRARLPRGATSARSPAACPPRRWPRSLDGTGCLLVADPDGPGPRGRARARDRAGAAALGPGGRAGELGDSWSLARALLRRGRGGRGRGAGLLARRGAPRRPAAVRGRGPGRRGSRPGGWRRSTELTPKARERMEETALAYVRHGGNAVAMARGAARPPADGALPARAAAGAARRAARRPRRPLRARAGPAQPGAQSRFLRCRGRVRKTTSQSGEETP